MLFKNCDVSRETFFFVMSKKVCTFAFRKSKSELSLRQLRYLYNNLKIKKMGKNVGLIGSVSGKVGNVVYANVNGIQTVRVYNPNVLNPKSAAQTEQRAKVALAGQLSSVVPSGLLNGMLGTSKSFRRGDFVRGIVRKATYANGYAKVLPEDIIFSKGSLQPHTQVDSIVLSTPSNHYARVAVTLSAGAVDISTRPLGYGEQIVVLVINPDTSQYDFVASAVATLPTQAGQSQTTQIGMQIANPLNTYTFMVYRIPFQAADDMEPVGYSYLGLSDGSIAVRIDNRLVSSRLVYGQSVYDGIAAEA